MIASLRSFGKFFFKMRIVSPLRAALLACFGPRANREGWEKRMLIVNLEALGDLVMFTGVLKHYKQKFPDRRIVLAIKAGTGLEEFFHGSFVDAIVSIDYRRFAIDPFYGFQVIASLRTTGFHTVVNQDFSASEIMGKIIATSLGAEQIIGSDGLSIEFEHSFDIQQVMNLAIIEHHILPRYTSIVSTRGMKATSADRLPNVIAYYARIFEHVVGGTANEYAPTLATPEGAGDVLEKFVLAGKRYAVMNVSASVAYKRWPIDRFVEMAKILVARGLVPILIGTSSDRISSDAFAERVPTCLNLVGQTSLHELIVLIAKSYLVFTNDTSTVHLAVALRKPSLCITGGGQFGMQCDYGYSDINHWAYARTDCYGDNFRCGDRVPPGEPSPCIASVLEALVSTKLTALLDYLDVLEREGKNYPHEPFRVEF